MENFSYYVPTEIYFGEGSIQQLSDAVARYGDKVLLVYGGGSIKKIGLYKKVKSLLKDVTIHELSGVEPNPRLESVVNGVNLCKENDIQVVLAVGGGSTIDCAKAICAGMYYDGNPWDFIEDSNLITEALPLISVLTLSATGSEMDATAVITNPELKLKKGFGHRTLFPKVSIMDPTYTYSVSKYQTASGTADIMSHIMETYFNDGEISQVSNQISVSLLKTCLRYGKIAYNEPENYEARANMMWTSSLAINGLTGCGVGKKWSCHAMEHVLSAYYDVTHGAGLAMLTPRWMEYILDGSTVDKFASYGRDVWGLEGTNDMAIAKIAIQKTKEFFESLDLPMTFEAIGIPEDAPVEEMAASATASKGGKIDGYRELSTQDVINIYRMCM
ncbi:iron-containing alcohol dehydrogenase [Breznakia pachnodae]|uniref:Alcohol dehydrogenase YqhD (Iron-dependent ADH family) n=1 Tax=Breznakia pachnodae TaxID=265178 RepID=A0ABU0DYA9_9FIRM|nr:iron-containing alcohol dehydrogenase [Breznakia pachnodae]MDQ0359624.1 alcohol dehydrogenase YqhD (iron-dependent ADH family) [Breznakia pachnodae]